VREAKLHRINSRLVHRTYGTRLNTASCLSVLSATTQYHVFIHLSYILFKNSSNLDTSYFDIWQTDASTKCNCALGVIYSYTHLFEKSQAENIIYSVFRANTECIWKRKNIASVCQARVNWFDNFDFIAGTSSERERDWRPRKMPT